jgi:hypothetical protein
MFGVRGTVGATNADAAHCPNIYGLSFETVGARTTGSPSYTEIIGAQALWGCAVAPGTTIADGASFKAGRYLSLFATVTRNSGVWVPDIGRSIDQTVYGIRVDDQTLGTNRYLAWLGGATPNLRVDAGSPAADLSQCWIAVNNGSVVSRQIQIGAADSGGAGYRMLRVLN